MNEMTRISFLLLIAGSLLAGTVEPTREISLPNRHLAGDAIPAFSGGRFFLYDARQGSFDPRRSIRVFDRDGKLVFETALIRNGGTTLVSSAASDGNGAVAVGVTLRGGNNGIIFFDGSGKQTRLIETGAYIAVQLCFGPDRALWVFGWHDHVGSKQDYGVVRRYPGQSQRFSEYLPRSSSPKGLGPAVDVGLAKVFAARDRIGKSGFSAGSGSAGRMDRA